MRGLNLLLCLALAFTIQFANAQQPTNNKQQKEVFLMPDEEIAVEKALPKNLNMPGSDPFETDEWSFKRQIGITQAVTGSLMIPTSLTMICVGAYRKNNAGRVGTDGNPKPDSYRKGGIALISMGSMTGVAGAILILKGQDTIRKVKNHKGETIAEITLPSTGDAGLAIRF